jgi:anti-sigma factor RsiW
MNERLYPLDIQNPHCQLHNCEDVLAHLGDYVDKDLPLEQKTAIDNHLDVCPACSSFYASYKHVVDSAAKLREEETPLPVGVQNRLRKALNDRLGINLPLIA